MMSAALKELAVEMNLFIMTSTQTNAKVEEEKGIKNEAVIRGRRKLCLYTPYRPISRVNL